MVCIHCGGKTQVTNSRAQKRSNQIWRRRQCLRCQAIFSTEEVVDYSFAWLVQDSGGDLRPFNRDMLFLSVYDSCQHRKTALNDAGALTDTIVKKLLPVVRDGTIQTRTIIQMTQVTLNRFDRAASTRYTAVHKG